MRKNQENPSSSFIKDRLLLKKGKLPMKSNPFGREEDEMMSPIVTSEKSHFCSECNKGFSSGRALGGHISSAHVQANKGYYCNKDNQVTRKVVSDHRINPIICSICYEDFPSMKSLFGHMRSHPERVLRDMEFPLEAYTEDSCDQDREGDDVYIDGDYDDEDDKDEELYSAPMVQVVDLCADLKPWPVKAKRGGRGIRHVAPVVNNQEEAYPVKEAAMKLKRKSIDYRSKKLRKIIEYANTHFSEDTDSDTELLMNPKKNTSNYNRMVILDNQKSKKRKKVEAIIDDNDEDKKRYKCSVCNKGFTNYQALGGHKSSHNKFKLTIQNANNIVGAASSKDQQVAAQRRVELFHQALSGTNNQVSSPSTTSTIEDPQEAIVKACTLLAFDLNQLPNEMEDDGMERIKLN